MSNAQNPLFGLYRVVLTGLPKNYLSCFSHTCVYIYIYTRIQILFYIVLLKLKKEFNIGGTPYVLHSQQSQGTTPFLCLLKEHNAFEHHESGLSPFFLKHRPKSWANRQLKNIPKADRVSGRTNLMAQDLEGLQALFLDKPRQLMKPGLTGKSAPLQPP